jgi:dihydroorotate dehydrogenase
VEDVQPMVDHLEGREGLTGIELGIPPDCEPSQAVEMIQAAVGELPLIARVPVERAAEFAGVLIESPLAAISLAPPRGALLDQKAQPLRGRLFGPAVFPFALAAVQDVIEIGVPVIACGGVYQQQQVDAMLELGAMGVQLDAVLWSLGKLEGWE